MHAYIHIYIYILYTYPRFPGDVGRPSEPYLCRPSFSAFLHAIIVRKTLGSADDTACPSSASSRSASCDTDATEWLVVRAKFIGKPRENHRNMVI